MNVAFFRNSRLEMFISCVGENRLYLHAPFDDKTITALPYSNNAMFDYADANTLRFEAFYWQDSDGWTSYERGEAEPSF